ncbi:CapA family protein [Paenibacillus sp. GYB004]|uniref:CapA family protein n=1 Tax=Paenibacillus sp. GYB004 TaxID=2994393 RepID=UPI002F9662C2
MRDCRPIARPLLLWFAVVLLLVAGCSGTERPSGPEAPPGRQAAGDDWSPSPDPGVTGRGGTEGMPSGPTGPPEPPQPPPVVQEPIVTTKVTLAAIGDVLIHSSIYKDAKKQDGYDFVPMFERVRTYIEEADIAIANQESMIGGEALGLSDYPRFNSPYEIGDALKTIGFDVVSLANNHSMDGGEKAITNALAHWRKLGMTTVGVYSSEEDRDTVRVVDVKGIKFAFLAYTYGTNGIPVPAGKPYLVNLIDTNRAAADIEAARRAADVVVVSAHFGQEYKDLPDDSQKKFAREAAEAGADIVIGHHPHVLQPAEWIDTGTGRKTFVIYSLGNFIAAQEGENKRTGGILRLEIEKTATGGTSRIEVKHPSFIPTWITMTNWRKYKVVPVWEAGADQIPDTASHEETIRRHMSRWMPELNFPAKSE